MITSASISMGLMLSWMSKTINPVKTSVSILMMSMIMFLLMGYMTSMNWIPMLMSMLFMGGIIMMFMILSSILPNEKSMKMKFPMVFFMTTLIMILSSKWTESVSETAMETKYFLASGHSFMVMMILVIVYFLGSMSVLSAENTPMRSIYCYNESNFVN